MSGNLFITCFALRHFCLEEISVSFFYPKSLFHSHMTMACSHHHYHQHEKEKRENYITQTMSNAFPLITCQKQTQDVKHQRTRGKEKTVWRNKFLPHFSLSNMTILWYMSAESSPWMGQEKEFSLLRLIQQDERGNAVVCVEEREQVVI